MTDFTCPTACPGDLTLSKAFGVTFHLLIRAGASRVLPAPPQVLLAPDRRAMSPLSMCSVIIGRWKPEWGGGGGGLQSRGGGGRK